MCGALNVWCEYIAKLQEEEESNEKLCDALRQCTLLFSQDERYKSDEFKIWMQMWTLYISCCNYKLMHT